jgi:phenylalanyl-tRNA synthetase beta chain
MLISHNWLKKYIPDLDEKIDKKKLAGLLTESLAEVEQIIPIRQDLDMVICAEVIDVQKVPESTKLSICKLITSKEGPEKTVICGAPNVKAGMKVALALPGGKVIDGHNQNKTIMTIEQKELMNITSDGMICSARELGISNEHEGILVLETEMEIGKDLLIILKDYVYEIENKSLSHRPDCFSHEGIAREIAAICDLNFIDTYQDVPLVPSKNLPFELKVKVDKEICPRFNAICLADIDIGPSPLWLQSNLSAVGVRPINNVVDIANYVMFDKGQPIHTYDYDKIIGSKLIVKYAKNNEKAHFLNEKDYILDESMMVIANAENTENVAGIIGGSNSEISNETKNIIIEAANFNMYSIRKSSQALHLRTESSTRYEKGLDPSITIKGLKTFIEIVSDLAHGEIASDLIDYYPEPRIEENIELDLTQVRRFLGIELTTIEILNNLKKLHFRIVEEEKISALTSVPDSNIIIKVIVPTFRSDIHMPNDLLEEIARIFGYSNFKLNLPTRDLMASVPNRGMMFVRMAVKTLSNLGLSEILTYSFVGEKLYNNLNLDIKECLAIKNPISPELSYLRNSLIPNLIEKTIQNSSKYENIRIFEQGRVVYRELNEEGLHIQPNNLAGMLYSKSDDEILFYKIKGVVENFLNELVIGDIEFIEYNEKDIYKDLVHKGRSAIVLISGEKVGIVAEVSPEVMLNKLEIDGRIGFFEFDASKLSQKSTNSKQFRKLSIYQESSRDLTLLIPSNIKYSQMIKTIEDLNIKEIVKIDYLGLFIETKDNKEQQNMTIRIVMQGNDKTLTESEINTILETILTTLETKLQISMKK